MKTFYKLLSTLAFALVLFVPAKTAQAGEFPAGVSFKHIVGKVLEPHAGDKVWTTLDAVDFDFLTKYVRVCVRTESEPVFLRMNTTIAGTVAIPNLLVFPGDSSTVFIDGTISGSYDFGALPMTAAATSGATGAAANSACVTEPWVTRGIIAHIVSGLATLDVWGYQ